MQHNIVKDIKMKNMLHSGTFDTDLVTSWMREYGLFQGINTSDRKKIAAHYATLAFDVANPSDLPSDEEIKSMFRLFLTDFYKVVPRKWLSATSKLLWCSFPDQIVIYDAFVERALVVLQGITPYLAEMPRIKSSGTIKSENDIEVTLAFYENYQSLVRAILAEHQKQLDDLRSLHNETYPHDIRIVDKLLWMLGNPNQSFQLNGCVCNT
jgi:hypothetical protein